MTISSIARSSKQTALTAIKADRTSVLAAVQFKRNARQLAARRYGKASYTRRGLEPLQPFAMWSPPTSFCQESSFEFFPSFSFLSDRVRILTDVSDVRLREFRHCARKVWRALQSVKATITICDGHQSPSGSFRFGLTKHVKRATVDAWLHWPFNRKRASTDLRGFERLKRASTSRQQRLLSVARHADQGPASGPAALVNISHLDRVGSPP